MDPSLINGEPKIKEELNDPKSKSILHEAFLLSIEDGSIVHSSSLLNSPRPAKQRHIYESPEARARRLARNAERMRERRANETEEEYRLRLMKMAEANRLRRKNENEIERTMRHLKDAARQRLRRAMESPEQRAHRLAKLAERSRFFREHETPEQKAERRRKCLEHNRARFQKKQQLQSLPDGGASLDLAAAASAAATKLNIPIIPTSCHAKIENPTMTPSPSGSSNLSPISGASSTPSYENIYQTAYHTFRPNQFPDLPPHLAPNQPKYYGHIQNFMPPNPTSLHYIPSTPPVVPPQTQIAAITSTTLTPSGIRPSFPLNHLPTTYQSQQQQYPDTSTSLVVVQQQPEINRGRPIKILPSNDYQSIAPALQEEAIRQQKISYMLEEQINIMLTSPKSARGRPHKGPESDPERSERLRKMAENRRAQREKEKPEERQLRLKDLAERARKRRSTMLTEESPEERKVRLQRQAEYARQRRLKCQTPQAIRQAEQRAKTLYAKLHQ